jgi:2-dehydro-3-deoxyglucarate aldolase/4-hydroxy-2-oxoheptanedioate aldolase
MVSDVRNPEIAYILAAAGMDFLMLDLEHSSAGLESVQNIVRAARSAGITPLARVTDNEYAMIARVLDTGLMGIMVPRVETAEQARHAVSCARYPPLGARGFGGRGPITDYEDAPLAEVLEWVNENTLIIVQVESLPAIDNLDEITRVAGIDAAVIGPNDLSISLGIPGQYKHPLFLEAVDRIFETCLRNGVSPAMHTGDLESVKASREKGARFLIYSNETRMLLGAAKAATKELAGERGFSPTVNRS